MNIHINAFCHEKNQVPITLDRLPDLCPVCTRRIRPEILASHFVYNNFRPLHIAFICPATDCRTMFIGIYLITTFPPDNSIAHLSEVKVLKYVAEKIFPESIQKTSPIFCETYNQAYQAEENNLNQVCGPGYRKALEFLIKDFLINYRFANDEETKNKIIRNMLGKCIEDYIEEEVIKSVARRAAWLGNDEIHYYRKWNDRDISDLKTLISLTVNWIDLIIQSDTYIKDMPE